MGGISIPPRPSLAGRAALVLAMVALFYALTTALAFALIYLPCLVLRRVGLNPFNGELLIASYASLALLFGLPLALTILLPLLPRSIALQSAGPLLTPTAQPRLFAEIASIARALGEPPPGAVYLISQPTAGVGHRGGLLGFGGQRVMALGLPLLSVLTVSELRAVLAHEFGHYYAGDTRLARRVHAVHSSILRTLLATRSQAARRGQPTLARWTLSLPPLVLGPYWRLFLRVTLRVSRQQEFRADELACALAGPAAFISALRKLEAIQVMLPQFWIVHQGILDAGCRVPLAASFARFMSHPKTPDRVSGVLNAPWRSFRNPDLGTHPPIADRLAAAAAFSYPSPEEISAPAFSLVDDLDNLELDLLRLTFAKSKSAHLPIVPWDRVMLDVHLPRWRADVVRHSAALAEVTVDDLPRLSRDPRWLMNRIPDPPGILRSRHQRWIHARGLLQHALIVALVDRGWELHGVPGEFWLQLGERTLRLDHGPFGILLGQRPPEDWMPLVESLGLAGLKLAPAPPQFPLGFSA